MQVSSASNINFSSRYYVSNDAKKGANVLLNLMKKGTVHKQNPKTENWSTEILSTICMGDVKFTHSALFNPYTDNPEINKKLPDCTLQIGKNLLNINSETGEVLSYKTGFFTSLSHLISGADRYIKDFINNFSNSEVVTKKTFEIGGYIRLL